MDLPVVSSMPVGVPSRRVLTALREFAPDVVHLAAPFVVGYRGLAAARRLGHPDGRGLPDRRRRLRLLVRPRPDRPRRVALDVPAARAGRPHARPVELGRPRRCARAACPRVHQWARGVDTRRFTPSKRDAALRAELAPDGELLVGYVGRLAPEKQVERLAALAELPGTRLVVVGDGPERGRGCAATLPGAAFLGFRERRRAGPDLRVARRVRAHRAVRDVLPGRAGGAGVRAAGGRAGRGRPARPGAARPHRLPGAAAARGRRPDDPASVAADAELRAAVRRCRPALRAPVRRGGPAGRCCAAPGPTVCDELLGHYAEVIGGSRRGGRLSA